MWADLQRALDQGAVIAYGATPGWAAWLAAQLAEREPLVVVVAADDAAAHELESDVRFFVGGERDATELDPIAPLPGIDVSPYTDLSPDRSGIVERERYRRLVEAARRVNGAENAAVSVGVPFLGGVTVGLWVPGRDSIPALPGGGPWATAVDENYFATMGTTIRRGRAFTAEDREGSEAVVIVNEAMARALWPDREAIRQCFHIQAQTAPRARGRHCGRHPPQWTD